MTPEQQQEMIQATDLLQQAKKREAEAKAFRIKCELELIKLTGFDKPEGSETFTAEGENGSHCKVTVKQPINTTVDAETWLEVRKGVARKHWKVMRPKFEIVAKEARAIQDENKPLWATIAQAVTRKPGKPSVEIKAVAMPYEGVS